MPAPTFSGATASSDSSPSTSPPIWNENLGPSHPVGHFDILTRSLDLPADTEGRVEQPVGAHPMPVNIIATQKVAGDILPSWWLLGEAPTSNAGALIMLIGVIQAVLA
ncbi:MAG: hypothetical protein JW934_12690 [Anaerolineae bacterium]|nr:hypothetical protein [Anaerolineae bacterium]